MGEFLCIGKYKHVVVHYIVIKYTSCDTVVFDCIHFPKFYTHNGHDTLPIFIPALGPSDSIIDWLLQSIE